MGVDQAAAILQGVEHLQTPETAVMSAKAHQLPLLRQCFFIESGFNLSYDIIQQCKHRLLHLMLCSHLTFILAKS